MNKKLGILLFENVQPIDVIGPWEVFSSWKKILNAPIDMYLISQNGSYVQCESNLVLKAHCDFAQAPSLDYFIVPGGQGRLQAVNNAELIAFIKAQAKSCQYLLSVCTGVFLLHKAGMLNGKFATTYWRALPELRKFNDVTIVEDRIVKNGNLWMSGGLSSGIDLALALIAEIAGKEAAGQVQLLFEYFPNNTVYCTADTAAALPPYGKADNNEKSDGTCLPAYIQKYLAAEEKS